jgi:hypothetical protein
MRKTPRTVKQITVSPPKIPPTIGPILFKLWSEGPGVEAGVDGNSGKPDKTPALEVGGAELSAGTLRSVDVVSTATFGSSRMVSVLATFPQAMYSND